MLKVENDLRTKNRLFARYFPGSYAEMFCCILNDARCERWRQSSRLGIPEYLLILHQGAPKTRWANTLIAIWLLYFCLVFCTLYLYFVFSSCTILYGYPTPKLQTYFLHSPTNQFTKQTHGKWFFLAMSFIAAAPKFKFSVKKALNPRRLDNEKNTICL